jgi:hypothetical protein
MEVRYYRDAETGLPHIYNHGVTEAEAELVVAIPARTRFAPATRDRRSGRRWTARVVYVPDDEADGVFVVTAYPLAGKQLKAFRRRQRRRGR